jgi:hypothetical protein
MPRGYRWCRYYSDDGRVFALRVDADYQLQPQRGFNELAEAGEPPLPRGWLPRAVVGLEPSGRVQRAIVGHVDAELWSGTRDDFDVVDSNGDVQTCTVVAWYGERSSARP